MHMFEVVFQACVCTILVPTCKATSCLMGVLAGLATLNGAVLAGLGQTAGSHRTWPPALAEHCACSLSCRELCLSQLVHT